MKSVVLEPFKGNLRCTLPFDDALLTFLLFQFVQKPGDVFSQENEGINRGCELPNGNRLDETARMAKRKGITVEARRFFFHQKIHHKIQGSLDYPVWGGSNLVQINGDFEGFPFFNSGIVWVGNIMTPEMLPRGQPSG